MGDIRCILFPDDVESRYKKVGKESSLSSVSSAKSWQKCGDSFLDVPESKVKRIVMRCFRA